MRNLLRTMLVALLAALTTLALTAPAQAGLRPHPPFVQPLERAHAHNDYDHTRPLLDALDHGFTSVEADVWLVDGRLYIGHDAPDLRRTLEREYLEPLQRRVHAFGGSVHPGCTGRLRLLVDVKSGPETWATLERTLARYPDVITSWRDGR